MALCRWGECDLYIYESTLGGIDCHVAARRIGKGDDLDPIGLGHDGEFKNLGTWAEVLTYVTELKAAGYDVPDSVIEEIAENVREEQEEDEYDD